MKIGMPIVTIGDLEFSILKDNLDEFIFLDGVPSKGECKLVLTMDKKLYILGKKNYELNVDSIKNIPKVELFETLKDQGGIVFNTGGMYVHMHNHNSQNIQAKLDALRHYLLPYISYET